MNQFIFLEKTLETGKNPTFQMRPHFFTELIIVLPETYYRNLDFVPQFLPKLNADI